MRSWRKRNDVASRLAHLESAAPESPPTGLATATEPMSAAPGAASPMSWPEPEPERQPEAAPSPAADAPPPLQWAPPGS